jgi:hypothetical protein
MEPDRSRHERRHAELGRDPDQALANAYTIGVQRWEAAPIRRTLDVALAPKLDNTPHRFSTAVAAECYFSPSDGVVADHLAAHRAAFDRFGCSR